MIDEKDAFLEKMPLHIAVKEDSCSTARLLLEAGANVNEVKDGLTLLHIAVENKSVEMVSLLLEFRANVNPWLHYCDGKTPLYLAVDTRSSLISEMLLKQGASIQRTSVKDGSINDFIQKLKDHARMKILILEYCCKQSKDFRDSLGYVCRTRISGSKHQPLLITVLKKRCFAALDRKRN